MKPRPLRVRIVDALKLGPMTIDELARCLAATSHAVWLNVETIRQSGELARDIAPSRARKCGRPSNRYRVAA